MNLNVVAALIAGLVIGLWAGLAGPWRFEPAPPPVPGLGDALPVPRPEPARSVAPLPAAPRPAEFPVAKREPPVAGGDPFAALESLPLAQLRQICARAERRFHEREVESALEYPRDEAEIRANEKAFAEAGATFMKKSRFWKGEMTLTGDRGAVRMELRLEFYNERRNDGPRAPSGEANERLCYMMSFRQWSATGSASDHVTGAGLGGCGDSIGKRNGRFLIQVPTAGDDLLAPIALLIFVPLPESPHGPAEYLSSSTNQWMLEHSLAWSPIDEAEFRHQPGDAESGS